MTAKAVVIGVAIGRGPGSKTWGNSRRDGEYEHYWLRQGLK